MTPLSMYISVGECTAQHELGRNLIQYVDSIERGKEEKKMSIVVCSHYCVARGILDDSSQYV